MNFQLDVITVSGYSDRRRWSLEVNIKQAKVTLSRLWDAAARGEPVFITKNNAKTKIKLIAVNQDTAMKGEPGLPGYGMYKGLINMPPGWDSQEAIEADNLETLKLFDLDE